MVFTNLFQVPSNCVVVVYIVVVVYNVDYLVVVHTFVIINVVYKLVSCSEEPCCC
jgi:hypothetical protein